VKVLRGAPSQWQSGGEACAVTVGVFDGVHLGHREILRILGDRASASGLEPAVITFEPHPLAVVAPERAPAMLTGIEHRIELLGSLGVELVAVLPFDGTVREWSAPTFARETLGGALHARLVVVGTDFRFGRSRSGDVDLLTEMGTTLGFDVDVVPLVGDDRPVSSTRIREMIAGGDVTGAAAALGRPHELWGQVVAGDGRGRSIGIPTANLAVPPGMALPRGGVYAATAGRTRDEAIPAVANIGTRPTFDGQGTTVEAHLLGFDEDLYGKVLRLRFIDRIRDERRFDGPGALVAQIRMDIAHARRIFDSGATADG